MSVALCGVVQQTRTTPPVLFAIPWKQSGDFNTERNQVTSTTHETNGSPEHGHMYAEQA